MCLQTPTRTIRKKRKRITRSNKESEKEREERKKENLEKEGHTRVKDVLGAEDELGLMGQVRLPQLVHPHHCEQVSLLILHFSLSSIIGHYWHDCDCWELLIIIHCGCWSLLLIYSFVRCYTLNITLIISRISLFINPLYFLFILLSLFLYLGLLILFVAIIPLFLLQFHFIIPLLFFILFFLLFILFCTN